MSYESSSGDAAFLDGLSTRMSDACSPLEQVEQELLNASYAEAAAAEALGIAALRIEAEPQDAAAEAHDVLKAAAAEAGYFVGDEATLKYYSDPGFNSATSPYAFGTKQRAAATEAARKMIEDGTL